jgi:N-acetylglucosaminyldiphosphoundecaprenol N-acetyl-beta-D-mannosaminyltransferase
MKATDSRPAAHVLGVDVDAIDMEGALRRITVLLQDSRKSYVCVAGVHGVMEAQQNPQLLKIYSGSEMTIPDGMPLAWVGRMQGHIAMQRVTGPDLMLEVFRRKEFSQVTHFLYGGRDGIAEELRDKLTERFPWVKIVGTYTPPFRELSEAEAAQFMSVTAALKPDIIWIGISCPKQEIFMARYLPDLETKLMFGVGAAFDYHTGHIRDCADWIKHAGLQWLHRLLQDPRRLWRRYLRNNPAFVWKITLQMLGVRRYPSTPQVRSPEAQPHVQARS